jgi:endonuclease YncB( thermonuclease family)
MATYDKRYISAGVLILFVFGLWLFLSNQEERSAVPEIDAICTLDHVVDGDTIWVKCIAGFKEGERFKVRFADIDAPEMDSDEGKASKTFLEDFIKNATYLFLDVDDKYTYDKYGRVIAIVYLLFGLDPVEFINLNYYMASNKMAEWVDYHNSWHPGELNLIERMSIPEELASKLSPEQI